MTGVVRPAAEAAEAGDADQEEAEILAALDSGDRRRAVALCARSYGAAIGRLCMAMTGTQAVAEELAQDTLLVAYDSLESWRRDAPVRAWLLGIARRKCLKHLETHRRHASKLFLIKGGETAEPSDELLARRQRAEHARAALEQVRPTEREALLLRYAGELSFAAVASACGVEEATARKRVSRGIARLREVLKGTR